MAFSETLILKFFLKKYTVFILHAWAAKNRITIWCDLSTNLTSPGAGTREDLTPFNTQSCGSTDHILLLSTKTFPHYICHILLHNPSIYAQKNIKHLWNFNFYLICLSILPPFTLHLWIPTILITYILNNVQWLIKLLQVIFFSVSWLTQMLVSRFPVILENICVMFSQIN